ncbi:MFS transporter [Pseudoduganella plicata]|uniref:MFS transporter n=1 Tax=Pseudoduganella plicata TaxID=321984 RepID=A0A4P7BJ07_9BURK|nr:MFS transporter [Pseudoduganella plicata]QBQ37509.1 MFS transporter [Pseudoduganella plicata]GGY90796.1 MFS transporter [Pseudoduganella plicata]
MRTPESPPQDAGQTDGGPTVPIRGALAALSLSMLLPALGTSIANVALPTMTTVFRAPFQDVQWIVLAYLLAVTTVIVIVGRLGDLIGRRRLLLAGIGLFAFASGVCALASTLWMLVGARAAQGLGAAVMMALTMALVAQTVPKSRSGSAMGLLGTMSAIGTTLGPALGGLLIERYGWPSIFAIKVPLSLAALLLALRYLPADRTDSEAARPRFDHMGTLVLAGTLCAYAVAMTLGRGRFDGRNLVLLLGAVLGIALFVHVERKAQAPLIQPAMLRAPLLGAGLAASALVSTVMMATLVVGPFYLAGGLQLGPGMVGMALAAGPLVAALCGVPAGRLVDRFGAGRMASLGLLGAAGACAALALLPRLGLAGYVGPISALTACYALFQAANNTAVMSDIPADQRGLVSGMLNLSRNLGLVTGASVMGALFALATSTGDMDNAGPAAIARGMRTTFAVAAALILAAAAICAAARAKTNRPAPLET